jgi:hypothetical protein
MLGKGFYFLHNLDFPVGGVPQAREIIRKDNSIISIMKDNLHLGFKGRFCSSLPFTDLT